MKTVQKVEEDRWQYFIVRNIYMLCEVEQCHQRDGSVVKAPATKSHELSLIPGIPIVGGKDRSSKVVL